MLIKLYAIALPICFLLDLVWIGFVANGFYRTQLGELMKTNITWSAAISFYVLFIIGLVFFVIAPAVEKQSLLYALGAGAFFGLIAYATYDLTNLATIKNWPLIVSIVDMVWGAVLAAIVSGATYFIATKLHW